MSDFQLRKNPETGQVFLWEKGSGDWREVQARKNAETGEVFIFGQGDKDWRNMGIYADALPDTPPRDVTADAPGALRAPEQTQAPLVAPRPGPSEAGPRVGQPSPLPSPGAAVGPSTDPLLAALTDTTDDDRASRGLARSAYLSDGTEPQLGTVRPSVVQAPATPTAQPGKPDPFAGESFGDLAKRRGQQFVQGATEVAASVPEAIAITSARAETSRAEGAGKFEDERAAMLAEMAQRLQDPNLEPATRAHIERTIADMQEGQGELGRRAGAEVIPPTKRPIWEKGDQLRDASGEFFGKPDKRDQSFWAQVAQGAGNMTGLAASAALGPAGLPAGAGLGASMNMSQVYKEAKAAGASEEDAQVAARWGMVIGATEIIPINRALKLLPPRLREKVGKGFYKRLGDIAQGAGEEAAQEYLATVANNIVAEKIYDPKRGWTEGATEAALVGAVLGGGMGAVGTTLDRSGKPKADDLAPAQPEVPATPPQPLGPRTKETGPYEQESQPAAAPERPAAPDPEQLPEVATTPEQANTQPAQGGRVEIMDEVETVDGETRPTGRKVRVDLETGDVSPVADENSPSAETEAARRQPSDDQPVVGAGADPAAGGEAETERSERPRPDRRFLTHDETLAIDTDADTFQYKGGGDQEGVTDRLQGVEKFDPIRAGQVIVYERADGSRVIADGHQRTGLARRMAEKGQGDVGGMAAVVYREVDGYTPEEVMVEAALKNISEGSGTATDAARILRGTKQSARELGLPTNSALVRDAEGIRNLSDDAFGMVANGVATEQHGGIVGRVVQDAALHADILKLLKQMKPANAAQAEMIARDAAADSTEATQDSLFGTETTQQTLYKERAQVLDGTIKALKRDKALFNTLVSQGSTIESAGNQLDASANSQRLADDAMVLQYLQSQANKKGPISDALTAAAKAVADGQSIAQARKGFVEAVRRTSEGGSPESQGESPGRRDPAADGGKVSGRGQGLAADAEQQRELTTETTPEGEQGVLPGAEGGSDQQAAARRERDRAEIEARQKQSKARTGAPQGDAGPLFDTQGDLLDTGQAAPEPKGPPRETGADLISAGRNTLDLYKGPNDPKRKNFVDLSDQEKGIDLADRLAAVDGIEARARIADEWVLEAGRRSGVEHLVILDSEGRPLLIAMGKKNAVDVPESVTRAALDDAVAYTTHNHPGGRSFSVSDFRMLSMGYDPIVAMGHNGHRHEARMTEAARGVVDHQVMREVYAAVERRLKPLVQKAYEKRADPSDDTFHAFNQTFHSIVTLALDRMGLIVYNGDAQRDLDAAGVSLDDFYQALEKGAARPLGRAGFDVSAQRDRGEDPGSGRRAGDAGDQGGTRVSPKGAQDRDTRGRAEADTQVTGDADFDAALDDIFGKNEAGPDAGRLDVRPPPARLDMQGWRKDPIDFMKALTDGQARGLAKALGVRVKTGAEPRSAIENDMPPARERDAAVSDWIDAGRPEAAAPKPRKAKKAGTPSLDEARKDHEAADAAYKAEFERHQQVSDDYHAQKPDVGDEEFFASKERFDAAMEKVEAAKEVLDKAERKASREKAGAARSKAAIAKDLGDLFSEGQGATITRTDTDAFREWFGDSKVVDENGAPLVVYHGTRADFEAFSDGVTFFAFDRETADDYAVEAFSDGDPSVIEAYLRVENPAGEADVFRLAGVPDDGTSFAFEALDENVVAALRSKGFDGIVFENDASPSDPGGPPRHSIAVFSPEQVKSVNNRGTFDPDDANMFREEDADGALSQERYAKAVPLFREALADVDMDAMSRREVFTAMARPLVEAGLDRAALVKMKPYFDKFLEEVENGALALDGGKDAPGTDTDLERDRGDAESADGVGGADVPAARGSDGSGARQGAGTAGRGSGRSAGGGRVSSRDAADLGGPGDTGVSGRNRAQPGAADDRDGAGGRADRESGLPDDRAPDRETARHATDGAELSDRRAAQAEADTRRVRFADEKNIEDTLPLLLPEQRDDVLVIERRFAKPDGHGMLLTNGTGTGKTYSGGGVIKRMVQSGKDNILIATPDDGIMNAWIAMGDDLGVPITKLRDTRDAGQGVVVTTYANLGQNTAIASRDWDLVVTDEAHKLSQNAAGDATDALKALRAITHRPQDLWWKHHIQHADEYARLRDMPDGDARKALGAKLRASLEDSVKKWEKQPRSKVLFLSATPFSYDKNLDYAEGYLFDYGEGGTTDSGSRQDGRAFFYVKNFGYRIRYHKLTKPEGAVGSAVFEREFHEQLKKTGALAGRSLTVSTDYDRKFVATRSEIGDAIDKAFEYLWKNRPKGDTAAARAAGYAWDGLQKAINRNFRHHDRMQLLEAIKANAAADDIRKHLAMGRKVVVFHDFNKGGGKNPFNVGHLLSDGKEREAYAQFRADNPILASTDFHKFGSPITTMRSAFGDRAVFYNGTESKADRKAAIARFNDDEGGVDLIVVQADAGSAGISLHDTTGQHQRVLINLGMPPKPTTALQEEGRIRRVGVQTNAAFRYYTIGTTWERAAFADKIASRSGTVENLALGNQARAIRDSFIEAYVEADANPPSDSDGQGGMGRDRVDYKITPYEKAKTHYFGRMKSTGRRDRRKGLDFYATPEPLGYKMVEWGQMRPNEKALEPSVGDGAIGRYFPENVDATIVDSSMDLLTDARLRMAGARAENMPFEDLHVVNKFDTVVMNPPFGSGGKMAYEHLQKAFGHVRPGGRVVALVPTGPAADKRFEEMLDEGGLDLTEWNFTADISLPAVTFEKAGTSVAARVMIFDRVIKPEAMSPTKHINLSGADSINSFFDRLEGIGVPDRPVIEAPAEADTEADPAAPRQIEGIPTFTLAKTWHAKNGHDVFVATADAKMSREAYLAVNAAAKAHGGYYSKFKRNGAIPGFQFKSEEARQAFLDDVSKPAVSFEEPDGQIVNPPRTRGLRADNPGVKTNAEKPYAIWSKWEKRIVGYAATKRGGRSAVDRRDMQHGSYVHRLIDNPSFQLVAKDRVSAEPGATAMDPVIARQVMPRLRAELDRLNLKRVRLGLDPSGAPRAGAFLSDGMGQMDILISTALDPERTLHHEVIHALRHMDLFTAAEWQALETAAAKAWVAKHGVSARYPNLMPSEQIEEAIAEEFAERAAERKAPKGPLLVQAFNKIVRVLKAIRQAVTGRGYPTPESVFGDVLAGQIGARDAGNTGLREAVEKDMALAPRQGPQARAHARTAMGPLPAHIPDRRVWDELTRSNRGMWDRLRGSGAAAYDQIDKARIRVQDRFLPVLRAQQAVMRATGVPLSEDHDAYAKETTFSGKVGRHLFEIDEDYTKPIIELIAETKGTLDVDEVGTFLYARHAKERNARIASINPNMPDGGSGMTDAEADAIMAQFRAGPYWARLQRIGGLVDALRERTLALREDAGLITPEEATLWRNQYRAYVPLKGFADTDHSEAMLDVTGIGRRFNTRGQESRRALGRDSEAFNPLQAAITQAQEVAIRAEKNRVGQALYRLAKDHPSKALWTVKKPKQVRYFNRTTGMVETRAEDPRSLFMDPDEMAVKIAGVEHRIKFHDERLARAAGSVGADQMGWFISLMSKASRWFSAVNTMLDPEFVIRNAVRDMTAAQINIRNFGGDERNALAKAMVRSWPKAWAAAMRGQKGTGVNSEWDRWWTEFEQAGGKVSFWRLEQPEAGKSDMEKRIKLASGNLAQRASRFARISTRDNPILGFIERLNLAVDNAVRLAAYAEARKKGWSKQDAANLSKNLTVNFNRRGEWGATINALYPFANASIQGTQILFRAMSSKRMAKYAIGMVALGVLLDQVNAHLSEEDEDGELAYDKIPDWKNSMNLVVMLGPESGNAATVWLPYGYSLFPYMGQQASKILRGVKDPGDAMADFAAAAFGAFSPMGGRDLQSTLTPTMLDPINEMAMNQDWLGRPIRPERPYDDYGPDAYKYYRSATTASRKTADVLNRATGGNTAEAGAIDVSPEYIDHFFGFVTGGAGRFTGRTIDTMGKLVGGEADQVEPRNIPFYRSLQTDTGDWLDRNRYYTFREELREDLESADLYREAGRKVPDHIRRATRLEPALKEAEKILRAQRKALRALDDAENLASDKKSERRERIRKAQHKVQLMFNRRYIQVMGRQGE